MVIGYVFAKRAFITPDRPALFFHAQEISFLRFDRCTNQTANALLAQGVKLDEPGRPADAQLPSVSRSVFCHRPHRCHAGISQCPTVFVDRLKDMIVSSGENVYPTEIEKILLQLPDIHEASMVGIADDKWGEVPKAYIVCKHAEPPSKDEIIAFCRQHLAGYKVLGHIEQLEELPKNSSGKVLKKVLRQRL